jgi:pimeloyl-ACP methyl ester carboxylesterase
VRPPVLALSRVCCTIGWRLAMGGRMQRHWVEIEDGQRLAVFDIGEGSPLLLASGIGVHHEGMVPLTRLLAHRHRVLMWDYRGMGESVTGVAVPDMSVERHARDALAIMDTLAISSATVVGWSMGVPVGVEILRMAANRVTAFAALFGSPGRPFDGGFPKPVSLALQSFLVGLRRLPRVSQVGLDLAVTLPGVAFGLLSAMEFVGRDAPRKAFDRQVKGVAKTPKPAYFQALLEMARHDARDVLPGICCPTLVVGGGKDWLTPEATARNMAAEIPNSRLQIFPDASHFGIIEKATQIDALLEVLVPS